MAGTSSKTKPVSVRIPNETLAIIDGHAARHGMSRAAAILHFIQAGIDTSSGESTPATRDDMSVLVARLDAIEESAKARHEALQANRNADIAAIVKAIESQPIAVQESPTLPDPDAWKKKSLFNRLLKK